MPAQTNATTTPWSVKNSLKEHSLRRHSDQDRGARAKLGAARDEGRGWHSEKGTRPAREAAGNIATGGADSLSDRAPRGARCSRQGPCPPPLRPSRRAL